jgi:Ca2+-binding EF-hand superfamily protein
MSAGASYAVGGDAGDVADARFSPPTAPLAPMSAPPPPPPPPHPQATPAAVTVPRRVPPSSADLAKPVVPPGSWLCGRCTLVNADALTKCDACELPRPGVAPTAAASLPQQRQSPARHAAPQPAAAAPWTRYANFSQLEYDHAYACFWRFCSSDSGRMGRGDMTRLCRFLNFAHSDAQIAAMFAEMDKNRDGTLNAEEFVDFVGRHRPDPQLLYGMDQPSYHAVLFCFDKFDANHDGFLACDEAARLAVHIGAAPDIPAGTALFEAIDLDRDGRITLHELLVYRAIASRQSGAPPPPLPLPVAVPGGVASAATAHQM